MLTPTDTDILLEAEKIVFSDAQTSIPETDEKTKSAIRSMVTVLQLWKIQMAQRPPVVGKLCMHVVPGTQDIAFIRFIGKCIDAKVIDGCKYAVTEKVLNREPRKLYYYPWNLLVGLEADKAQSLITRLELLMTYYTDYRMSEQLGHKEVCDSLARSIRELSITNQELGLPNIQSFLPGESNE